MLPIVIIVPCFERWDNNLDHLEMAGFLCVERCILIRMSHAVEMVMYKNNWLALSLRD